MDLFATYVLLSVGAQLGAAPLIAYYFHTFSLVSVFVNTIVVPVVPLLLAFGFLACGLGSVAPPAAWPFDQVLNLLLLYVISMIRFCARLPFANLNVSSPPIWALCLYYGLMAFLLWRWRRSSTLESPA